MLPSGLPTHVADTEVIARHIFRPGDVKGKTGAQATPKRQAYMPVFDEETREWVLSVSRTELLIDQNGIERNGVGIGMQSNRVMLAYTWITAADIRAVPCVDEQRKKVGHMDILAVEPPLHHCHIVKYPDQIAGENPKLLQMECALELARRSAPVIWRSLPLEPWELAVNTK